MYRPDLTSIAGSAPTGVFHGDAASYGRSALTDGEGEGAGAGAGAGVAVGAGVGAGAGATAPDSSTSWAARAEPDSRAARRKSALADVLIASVTSAPPL